MLVGQQVVQHAENALFHFAGVARAANQNHLLGEVEDGEVGLPGAVHGRVGLKAGGADDAKVGQPAGVGSGGGAQEHVVAEQVVPGLLVHDAQLELVVGVGTGVGFAHIQLLVGQVGHHFLVQLVKLVGVEGDVDITPPHAVFGVLVAHHEPVFGRAAGELAGVGHQGSVVGEVAFLVAQGVLNELSRRQIEVYRSGVGKAQRLQTIAGRVGKGGGFLHGYEKVGWELA